MRAIGDMMDGWSPGQDLRADLLALAAKPVRIINAHGKKETVSLFEARLLELATGKAPRRIHCQDFIWLLLQAASMTAQEFDATHIRHRLAHSSIRVDKEISQISY
ncbi:hypothetical protein ASE85_04870 [Sphingobium sp. Leaf26]|uniref:hypothetical protein n=1 Tax=Sphingobium sp. Leaf26 TaxID=1735693 RepID=UPI0006FE00C4|nr:hypothetical protein [Sphingobium sp. Leaf26]KQN04385.1 hypothetical protein ASE85_04870 [Sphingobium sp. Leaf26]